MVLNEVARQTGVYVRTLRFRARKLFGRTKGEFTDAEVDAILESLIASKQWLRAKEKSFPSETGKSFPPETEKSFPSETGKSFPSETEKSFPSETGKSFPSETEKSFPEGKEQICSLGTQAPKLDRQLVLSIDKLLQFKVPHWKDYDRHLSVLEKLLTEVSRKGAEQYERDLIEAQQLAEEYNQWLDDQLEYGD